MELYKYVAVWILLNMKDVSNAIIAKCERKSACFCATNVYDIEFQCPNENNWKVNLLVKTKYNEVKIQCRDTIDWHNQILPLLDIDEVDYLTLHMCTVPTNFATILDRLHINMTKQLKIYNSTDLANSITLTADYLKGLANLEALILNFVNIISIVNDAFQSLANTLIELDLAHNKIQLKDGVFKNLKKLKLLDLADNELSYLPSEIFKDLSELSYLGLNYNKFTRIEHSIFKNLKNLKILQLRDIQLEDVPENIFYYLENLQQIDLSINKFQKIPKDLFRYNKLLDVVMMLRNPNVQSLPHNFFSNLTELRKIHLNECNLSDLRNTSFEGLIGLEFIDLQSNEIEYIPNDIFKDLGKLQDLNLGNNKISSLSKEVFSSLTELISLNLENNLLTNIKQEHFYNLRSLEELYLENNDISSIDATSFQGMKKLKIIELANNSFDIPINVSLFNENFHLKKVDLSGNKITTLGDFTTFSKLKELDVSYNRIRSVNFSQVYFGVVSSVYINLKHNNIRTMYFNDDEVMGTNEGNAVLLLNNNPLDCNCRLFNFLTYLGRGRDVPVLIVANNLSCSSPNDFRNVIVTTLKASMLTCSLMELEIVGNFTEKCSYRFRTLDKSLIVNCSNSNFTEPPKLILPTQNFFNQTEMYLERNLLTSGPRENTGYENVTKLNLSSNYIEQITWIPPKLKVLKLDNNKISDLNYEILNSSSVTNITLGRNPWKCECSTLKFISFLKSKSSKKEIDMDFNTITCKNNGKLLIQLNLDDICRSNTILVLGLGILLTLFAAVVAFLIAFYYCYQDDIKVWLFAHKIFLWFVIKNEIDQDKLYDAFISYSLKDEDFVLNELLPVLEQSDQPYKFCLQIRNWTVGELIFEQITASVIESRRTIVVLSRNFLDSEWGKMEFRTAHIQAIQEGARVILVLYGDVDIDSDLDDELKAFTRTNTYVKWGDPWFWNRLKYALPHSHAKIKKKENTEDWIELEKLNKVEDTLDVV